MKKLLIIFLICILTACSKDVVPKSPNELLLDIKNYSCNMQISYFSNKINDPFGYIATGESGNIQGAIIAFPDSMQAPLDCMRLWIHPFVEPEYRNQGLGRTLVYEMYQYAKENNFIQLTNVDTSEDNIGFWYKIGFDIFFWEVKTQTGKRITTAMIRVK